jgi:radical SAM protein with 4Fe4S-binding SPASM domain
MNSRFVHADAPTRVYWEITRACALACRHCRAEATHHADPHELHHSVGVRLLRNLAAADPKPHLVLTGGDPLERSDLFELISIARNLGLHVSVSPSATPRLTPETIARLKDAGVDAISLSIDGSTAQKHDDIRQIAGTFERTLSAAARAREVDLAFQVNTLVSAETCDDLPAIETLVRQLGAARWSLFFLVSVGRGSVLQPIDADTTERLLTWFAERAKVKPGPVFTTTEAPFYRRIVARVGGAPPGHGHAAGIRDGNGVMFIGHDGEVYPSGFLPVSAGNVKIENPITIYREAAIFKALRNTDGFHGRCGRCEFRGACGGSRARAWTATGDVLGEDPLCAYQPPPRHEHASDHDEHAAD